MWKIHYTPKATQELEALPAQFQTAIKKELEKVASLTPPNNPRQRGEKVKTTEYYRFRVRFGEYRVICDIQDEKLVILCIRIARRDKVYKRLDLLMGS